MGTDLMDLAAAPGAWLSQLSAATPPTAKLALFRCSRQLRDLLLTSSNRVQLSLSPSRRAGPSAQLLRKCHNATHIKLVIPAADDDAEGLEGPANLQRLRLRSLTPAQQADYDQLMLLKPRCSLEQADRARVKYFGMVACRTTFVKEICYDLGSMRRIVHLELQGEFLDVLVPEYIAITFPNLTHLTRTSPCFLKTDSPRMPSPVFPRLQKLTLTHAGTPDRSKALQNALRDYRLGMHNPPTRYSRLPEAEAVQQAREQRQALPGLQSVCLEPGHVDFWGNGLVAIQSQVTCLELTGSEEAWAYLGRPVEALSQLLRIGGWGALRKLHLSSTEHANDGNVASMLQYAPNLRELDVWTFCLKRNHGSKQCSWQELTIRGPIDLQDFSNLPCMTGGTIRLGQMSITDSETLPAEASAAFNSIATTRVECVPGRGTLRVVIRKLRDPSLDVTVALCEAWSLLRAFLQQMQVPGIEVQMPLRLLLEVDCNDLLQQVPQLTRLELACEWGEPLDAQQLMTQLTAMCVGAGKAVTLNVGSNAARILPGGDGPSWHAQLHAAMQAAGHQHVKLAGFVRRADGVITEL